MFGKSRKYNTIEIFERLPVPQAVRAMAVPTIMGQLIVLIYNMADTFFIGRTNNPAMVAGASLILPVFNISISLACLAGVGGGTQISRLLGEKRHEEAQSVSSFSIWFSLLVGAAFSFLVYLFSHPLIRALGASTETEDGIPVLLCIQPLCKAAFRRGSCLFIIQRREICSDDQSK